MSTNPYAPPTVGQTVGRRAENEVLSVVRVFRMMSVLGFVQCGAGVWISVSSLTQTQFLPSLIIGGAVIPLAWISARCWRVATRMRARDGSAIAAAKRISWLLIFGLPVFPLVGFCLPVITLVGIICLRTIRRSYADYCAQLDERVEPSA